MVVPTVPAPVKTLLPLGSAALLTGLVIVGAGGRMPMASELASEVAPLMAWVMLRLCEPMARTTLPLQLPLASTVKVPTVAPASTTVTVLPG